MSDQDNKGPAGISPQGIFVVIAIIASLVVGTQFSFQSKRPPDPNISEFTPTDVSARLWEDPFAAVQNHLKKENANKSLPERSVSPQERTAMEILEKCDNATDNLTTLVVMVSGGPYNEDAENRLRSRHAVISGLDVLGYVPEYGRFISYMDNSADKNPTSCMPKIIPYEWFKLKEQETKKVLLMWLDDTAFLKQDKPLTAINEFIQKGRQSIGFLKLGQEISKKLITNNHDFGKALQDILEKHATIIFKENCTLQDISRKTSTASGKQFPIDVSAASQHNLVYLKCLLKKAELFQKGETLPCTDFILRITQALNKESKALLEEANKELSNNISSDVLTASLQPEQIEKSLQALLSSKVTNGTSDNRMANLTTALELELFASWTEAGNLVEIDKTTCGHVILKGLFKTALGASLHNQMNNQIAKGVLSQYLLGDIIYRILEQQGTYKMADQLSPELTMRYASIKYLIGDWILNSLSVPIIKAKIIGPTSSGILQRMVKEKLQNDNQTRPEISGDIRVFSPRATISDNRLIPADDASKKKIAEIRRKKNAPKAETDFQVIFESKPNVLRTIATDDNTTKELIVELARRGVDASKDRIYLVSEWDTLYGRELPDAFIKEAGKNQTKEMCNRSVLHDILVRLYKWIREFFSNETVEKSLSDNIIKLTYLRGIDGNLPNKPQKNEDKTQDNKAGAQGKNDQALEKATGDNQYDYLRRLAQHMKSLQADDFLGEVKAIGVLGSDAYDKLLVLQALRPLFPNTIFFTTDLDAVILQRDNYTWTHNLIVASSFGLQLNEKLQQEIPPFRDSYQTATFFTTLLAVGMYDNKTAPATQDKINKLLVPRIYEIGRSVAFDLSDNTRDNATILLPFKNQEPVNYKQTEQADATVNPIRLYFESEPFITSAQNFRPVRIHPQRKDFCAQAVLLNTWRLYWEYYAGPFGLFVLLLAFSLLFILYYCWLKQKRKKIIKMIRCFAYVALAALAVLILCIVFIAQQKYCGEPWALFEGISIWPTELMRFLCGILSFLFWYKSKKQMDYNDIIIENRYFRKPFQKFIQKNHPEYVNTNSVWNAYKSARKPVNRYLRVCLLTLLYLILCKLLISYGGNPIVPFRDVANASLDIVLNICFAVLLMLFLIFWVLDTTLMSIKLFRGLSKNITIWPDHIIEHYQHKLGMHKTDQPMKKSTEDVECLIEWIDIKVIAKHSEVVGKLIYYPFIVLCLMVLARNSYFDYWPAPLGLIIVIMFAIGIAASSMMLLRHEAEKARGYALKRLTEYQIKAKKHDQQRAEQIKLMIDAIQSLRTGAFAPFFEQPLVRSITLLLSSGGGLWFLDSIFKM